MAIIFPDNPQIGDTTESGGRLWVWDGERWLKYGGTGFRGSNGYLGSPGDQGPEGYRGSVGDPGGPQGYTGSLGYTGSTGAGYVGSQGLPGRPSQSQKIVADGSDTYYLLEYTAEPEHIIVAVNGLVQLPDTDYTINVGEVSITFNIVPASGSDIEIRYFGSIRGETGYRGSRGSIGSTGYQGSAGDRGYTGSRGSTGFTGSRGLIGPAGAPQHSQRFIGDGSTTIFNLEYSVFNVNHIFVIVNGLVQLPTIDYTVDLNEITFNIIPPDQSDIEIRYFDEAGYQGSTGYTGSRGSTGYRGSEGIPALAEVYMDPDPPPGPDDGSLWWDTGLGILNIYYEDESTWVGIAEGPRGPQGVEGYVGSQGPLGYSGSQGIPGEFAALGYTGSTGFDGSRGATGYDGSRGFNGSRGFTGSIGFTGSASTAPGYAGSLGYTGSVGSGYTGSEGFAGSIGSLGYSGSRGYAGSRGTDALLVENYINLGSTTGQVDLNVSNSNVYRIAPTGTYSFNFTNVSSIPNNKTTTFVVMVQQGATAYIPSSVSFDGVAQTLLWQGGILPGGNADKLDAISFTILKLSSGTTVLAQLIGFGAV